MKLNNTNTKYFKIKLKGTIYLFLFLLIFIDADAQKYNLTLISDSFNNEEFTIKESYHKVFNDSLNLFSELDKIRSKLFAKGYISASFDSIIFDSTNVKAYLYTGDKYLLQEINIENVDRKLLRKINFSEKKIKTNKISLNELFYFYKKIINYYENNGYPFATILPQNIEFDDGNIKLDLQINKNEFIKIKNIIIKGNPKLSEAYIRRYLALFENDVYNESVISSVNSKIEELSFVSQIRKPELEFYGHNADVYLYLKDKKANLFNGIVGFVPDRNNENKLSFTGDLDFRLLNNFGKGEEVYLRWNRIEKLSQKLNVGTDIPFLFKSPFGVNFNFKLDKKDTTFMSVFTRAGMDYSFKNNDKIMAYVKNVNSFILSPKNIDTTLFFNVKSLAFGMAFQTQKLDYVFNPSRGYKIYMNIAHGNRTFADKKYSYLDLQADIDYYISIFRKFVLKTAFINHYKFSETELFQNELFKIGGFNSVRGFDEDIFYTSGFSFVTGELRYLYERNSNVYVFFDFARTENFVNTVKQEQYLTGFGIGTNLNTKAGIFSIVYALGKQKNNNIQVSDSKIHIGYLKIF